MLQICSCCTMQSITRTKHVSLRLVWENHSTTYMCTDIYTAFNSCGYQVSWCFFNAHLCSPHRMLVSVTHHTCWCSVCCAVWVSYSVWPHQWLWSGQACGWPKNSTTICSIILSSPQWGTSKPSYSWSVYVEYYCILCVICHDWVTVYVGMYKMRGHEVQ